MGKKIPIFLFNFRPKIKNSQQNFRPKTNYRLNLDFFVQITNPYNWRLSKICVYVNHYLFIVILLVLALSLPPHGYGNAVRWTRFFFSLPIFEEIAIFIRFKFCGSKRLNNGVFIFLEWNKVGEEGRKTLRK